MGSCLTQQDIFNMMLKMRPGPVQNTVINDTGHQKRQIDKNQFSFEKSRASRLFA